MVKALTERTGRGEIRFGDLPGTISIKIREPGSALTHFAALILLLMGSGPLLLKASLFGSALTVFSIGVFLLTSCMLYAASSLYHSVVLDEAHTRIFKKIDHMMISVMIAGSYTPICLLAMKGRAGKLLLTAIWILAAAGITLKALWVTCPKWLSSALYLVMGWLCVFALLPLLESLPGSAFAWLLAGGIFYSIGALIYAKRSSAFDRAHPCFGSHEIFHCFIMAGTFCHYMVMNGCLAYLS